MALNCTDSDNFVINYQNVTYSDRLDFLVKTKFGGYSFAGRLTSQTGESLTYDLREKPDSIKYSAIGSFTLLSGYLPSGYSNKWVVKNFVYSPTRSLKFGLGSDNSWEIADSEEDDFNSGASYIWSVVNAVTDQDYNESIDRKTIINRNRNRYQLFSPTGTSADDTRTTASSINIAHEFQTGDSTWEIVGYKDGVEAGVFSAGIVAITDPRQTPDVLATSTSPATLVDKTAAFSKEKDTQAVEVVIDANNPHRKILYLVNLDAEGEEMSRTPLLFFANERNKEPPLHELVCAGAEQECPENTCKVDCGDYYCCYGSDGISIESFTK